MKLKLNFAFDDLYNDQKLHILDNYFQDYLAQIDSQLLAVLQQYRNNFIKWQPEHSQFIVNLAPHLENFIADFFSIEDDLDLEKAKFPGLESIYECKRIFVQRHALKQKIDVIKDIEPIIKQLAALISSRLEEFNLDFFEQIFSEHVLIWLKENNSLALEIATKYAIWATKSNAGQKKHQDGILFKYPHKIDLENLVPLSYKEKNNLKISYISDDQCHQRAGFKLTDPGCKTNFAFDQANYCIHCHPQEKDSCSKGLSPEKSGCPLDEKISEMNFLLSKHGIISPLAVAIIDNPMLAATGHRICNDCMKSCIFQKQQPVDIPQIETHILKSVLALPWGFEIYSLLTRWNPLSFKNPLPKSETGAKVLVAGMGPAGFTLSHYLLNQGHIVVAIDGLKIEPIDYLLNNPIKDTNSLFEDLDQRVIAGFGGVMEYGITNRWNKNFLLIIRLLLARRKNFKLFSGVRLGSNITVKQAFELGFQHIALALGAGSPKLPKISNIAAKGVYTASDFLMTLQLGTAYRSKSLTNLQIRMPIVVIGGGLTALDTATESLAYYPEMVKKFSENFIAQELSEEDQEIATEFIHHHKVLKQSDDQLATLKSFGGSSILYRGKISASPSYRLNNEELKLGLSEGVEFIAECTPHKIILDKHGWVSHIEAVQIIDGEERRVTIAAKTILIAAGTTPNNIIADEFPDFFELESGYLKKLENQFITYNDGLHSISFLGDLHPDYAGNVVKAMASAKHSYPVISKLLKKYLDSSAADFFTNLDEQLTAKLIAINRLTPNIVELIVKSKLAAQNFQPGQFFRLQNYNNGYISLFEPLALTGAKVDHDQGTISMIVLEMGASSRLCSKIKIGEEIVLMGPTGTATEIPPSKNIMLIGGGLGNAVLFSIGQALRKSGSQIIYFAGYKKAIDRYKIEEIEAASDQIIWSCDETKLSVTRPNDQSFQGNIIQTIHAFAKDNPNVLESIDHIIVIGSDKMMHAVKTARHSILKPFLNPKHRAIASVNSPMQCMMKEICGRCLQKHVDPITKKESYIFSCNTQDQEMDQVDFYHLEDRLSQNRLLERIND